MLDRSPIQIILCPIHSLLRKDSKGSEFAWAYSFYQITSQSKKLSCVYLTGATNVADERVKDLKTASTYANQQTINGDSKHSLILSFKVSVYLLWDVICNGQRNKIYHHFLPCAFGSSVNPFLVFFARTYVIGPVQRPLLQTDTDLFPPCSKSQNFIGSILTHIQSWLSRRFFQRASLIVAIDSNAKEYLIAHGIKREKIEVIPTGINCDEFTPSLNSGISKSGIKFVTAAHFIKRKGISTILKAINQLKNQNGTHTAFHLEIVGAGPEEGSLKELTRTLGVEKCVTFIPHQSQSDMQALYRKNDIYLNASRDESFGQTCLEALASGLPVIATPVGVFQDAITNGQNGFLYPVDDYRSLASILQKILDDQGIIETIKKGARPSALRYDWRQSILPKYIDLYEHLQIRA